MSSNSSRKRRNPERTTAWSSTSMTRVGFMRKSSHAMRISRLFQRFWEKFLFVRLCSRQILYPIKLPARHSRESGNDGLEKFTEGIRMKRFVVAASFAVFASANAAAAPKAYVG